MERSRRLFAFLAVWALALPVTALAADCAATDPENFEQVYACMASFRRGDRNAFTHIEVRDCRSIRMTYLSALVASGLSREEGQRRVPSCTLFARVVRDLSGKDAYWSGCIGFGSVPTPAHMARCLDRFVPGYYGGGSTARKMQGCGEVLGAYEKGLRAADGMSALPEGYSRPDCALVPDYLAASEPEQPSGATQATPGQQSAQGSRPGQPQWAQCLNYDPANLPAHLRRCLGAGPDRRRFKECQDVQAAYTKRLEQAYGGLPENFLVLPCSVAEGYLADIRTEENAEKQAALERRKEADRAKRAALVKQIETLRDHPPSRPVYAQPWVTWVVLLAFLAGIGRVGWRFVQRKRAQAVSTP
jgi:hypothetical protein